MTKVIRIVLFATCLTFVGCTYPLQLTTLDSPVMLIDIPLEAPEYRPAKIDFRMDWSTSKGVRINGSGKITVSNYNGNLLWDSNVQIQDFQFFIRWISKRDGDFVSYEKPLFITKHKSLSQEERRAIEEDFVESIKQSTMRKLPDSPLKSGQVLFSIHEYKNGIHVNFQIILTGWIIHKGTRHLFAELKGSGSAEGITAPINGFLIIDSHTFHAVRFEMMTTVESYSYKLEYSADVNPL